MLRYFLTRLAGAIPTLFIIVTLAFFLIRAAPGGPFDQEQTLPPEIMANLQRAYGLDQPICVQYGRYLGALAHGDFGPSFKYKDFSVTELIGQGFPVTLELGSIAMALALILGIPIGTFAALHHNSAADYATMPVAALALPPLSVIARLTRANMLEVLHSQFIRTAVAKGLPLHTVILRHAMRPALLPVASYLAPAVASIMTGSLVVESIAGLPGIGRYMVQGALNRDYTLVLGMVIIYSTLLIVMGLIVDLSYAWLDPRVKLER